MITIWSFVKKLQENHKLIKKYKDKSYEINAAAKNLVKTMSNEEVLVTLKKLYPYYTCYETFGPHDDYYVVQADGACTDILGSGDSKMDAIRAALSEAIWRMREK
jgi:hypothetical protein